MTKAEVRRILEKDYIEALAFFATMLMNEKFMYNAVQELDDKVYPMVKNDLELQDAWMRIYTALIIAADNEN